MDCVTQTHKARVGCKGLQGDAYDNCCLTYGLKSKSDDIYNEVVCKTHGHSKVYYFDKAAGMGQVQFVCGMQVMGAPSKLQ